MTPDLSLVICTMDEAEAIGPVLREALGRLSSRNVEIIVVDDSVNERTADVVRAYAAMDDRVRLVRRQGERGLAAAAAAGWAVARGRILGLMDGDGQHDPAVLPLLMQGLDHPDIDIAVASRYAPGAHTGLHGFRQGLSQCGTVLARFATGVPTTDPLSGCFLFRREWWEQARSRLTPVGYKILLDLALSGRRTARIFETPTALRGRLAGASKLDTRVIVELAAQLIDKRSGGVLPARFVMFAAVGVSGLAVNLACLSLLAAAGVAFWVAQAVSIIVAMTSNFLLNNLLTFRDRRLHGRAFWRGMVAFYAACTGGALINQAIGLGLYAVHVWPVAAGLTGAVAAALWNYVSVSRSTWGGGVPALKADRPAAFTRFAR